MIEELVQQARTLLEEEEKERNKEQYDHFIAKINNRFSQLLKTRVTLHFSIVDTIHTDADYYEYTKIQCTLGSIEFIAHVYDYDHVDTEVYFKEEYTTRRWLFLTQKNYQYRKAADIFMLHDLLKKLGQIEEFERWVKVGK